MGAYEELMKSLQEEKKNKGAYEELMTEVRSSDLSADPSVSVTPPKKTGFLSKIGQGIEDIFAYRDPIGKLADKYGDTPALKIAQTIDNMGGALVNAWAVAGAYSPKEREKVLQEMIEDGTIRQTGNKTIDEALKKAGLLTGDVSKTFASMAWAKQILSGIGAAAGKIPGATELIGKLPRAAKTIGTGVATGLTKAGIVDPLWSGEAPSARDLAAEGVFWGVMGGASEGLRNVMPETPTMIGRPLKTGASYLAGSLASAPIREEKQSFKDILIGSGVAMLMDAASLALSPGERAMAEGERKTALVQKKVIKPLSEFSKTFDQKIKSISEGDPGNVVRDLTKTRDEAISYVEHLAIKNKWSAEFEQYAKSVINNSINSNIISFNQQAAQRSEGGLGGQNPQEAPGAPIIPSGTESPSGGDKVQTPLKTGAKVGGLSPGVIVTRGDKKYEVVRQVDQSLVELKDVDTGNTFKIGTVGLEKNFKPVIATEEKVPPADVIHQEEIKKPPETKIEAPEAILEEDVKQKDFDKHYADNSLMFHNVETSEVIGLRDLATKTLEKMQQEGKEVTIRNLTTRSNLADVWGQDVYRVLGGADDPYVVEQIKNIKEDTEEAKREPEVKKPAIKKPEEIKKPILRHEADIHTLVDDYKHRGLDQHKAWDEYIKDKRLSPEVDKKEFVKIYENAASIPFPSEKPQGAIRAETDSKKGIAKPESKESGMKTHIERIKSGEAIPYYRNLEKAPYMGEMFGQDIEPAGEYMGYNELGDSFSLPNHERGEIQFKNPLMLEWKTTGHGGWKTDLSKMHGGLTGKNLTEAIKKAGYDGVIAYEKETGNIREIVNLEGEKAPARTAKTERSGKKAAQVVPGGESAEKAMPKAGTADVGGYAKRVPRTRKVLPLEMPELVELARAINNGMFPRIKERLGNAVGKFKGGTIYLRADIFKDPESAAKTMAHEIGHLVDYLPDAMLKRGNILGHIASLKRYLKHMISEIPVKTTDGDEGAVASGGSAASKPERAGKGSLVVYPGGGGKKKGFITKNEIMDELKSVSLEWKPFDPDADPAFTKYRFSPVELYADAVSILLNEPELLEENAPRFYAAFMNYLERKPKVQKVYNEIQNLMANRKDVVEKRLDDIKQMFVRDTETREEIDKRRNVLEPVIDTVSRWLVDKDRAVLKAAKRAGKAGAADKGMKTEALLEESRYIDGEIDNYLYETEKKVLARINEAGLSASDVGTYLFLKRVLSDRSEIANPLGHTLETAKETLKGLEEKLGKEKFKNIQEIADKFREIREELVLPRVEEAEMYSDDLLQIMKDVKEYVKFNVLNYMELKHGRSETARVYRQIGTLSEISNPLVSTILQDIAMLRAAKINQVKQAAIDMLRAVGEVDPAETYYSLDIRGLKAREPRDPNKKILSVMEKGKLQSYYVDKNIASTFEHSPYEATAIMKAWSLLNQPLRDLFVSRNPFWMIRNVIRDFNATVKGLPQMKLRDLPTFVTKHYKEAFKEAWEEVMREERSEDIKTMRKNWMIAPDRAYSAIDLGILEKIDRVADEFTLNVEQDKNAKRARNILKRVYDYIGNLGQITELGAKTAGYKFLKEKTSLSLKEIGHLVRTRVGTPDYRRKGSLHAITNNVFMFSNINKEGIRSAFESYKDNKGSYIWKTIMLDILPKLLLFGATLVGGEGLKKTINGISEYDKRSYSIIPLGLNENEKSVYLRIPQDYNSQIWGSITWDLLNGKIIGQGGLLDEIGQVSPYQLHPLITLSSELYRYFVKDINPQDDYRGRNILTPTVYQARGKEATKEMIKHTWKSLGGSIIYDPGGPLEYAESDFEKMLQYPPLNLFGTFLKVSDYGHKEKEMWEEKEEQRHKARDRLLKQQMDAALYKALQEKDYEKYNRLRNEYTEKMRRR